MSEPDAAPKPTYYLRSRGETTGPHHIAELQAFVKTGRLTPSHELSQDGILWMRAGQFWEVFQLPEKPKILRPRSRSVRALVRAVVERTPLEAVPGLALRRGPDVLMTAHPELPDLAKLPWPDRRGEPAACFGQGISPLVSSRGCYANCSFCCIAAWHEQSLPGKRYRERPLEDVADEMAAEHFGRAIEIFVFHEDNFFLHRRG